MRTDATNLSQMLIVTLAAVSPIQRDECVGASVLESYQMVPLGTQDEHSNMSPVIQYKQDICPSEDKTVVEVHTNHDIKDPKSSSLGTLTLGKNASKDLLEQPAGSGSSGMKRAREASPCDDHRPRKMSVDASYISPRVIPSTQRRNTWASCNIDTRKKRKAKFNRNTSKDIRGQRLITQLFKASIKSDSDGGEVERKEFDDSSHS